MKNVIFMVILILKVINSGALEWSSIQEMNGEFEKRFASEDTLSIEQWQAALSTKSEQREVTNLIDFLMFLDTFKGLSIPFIMELFPDISQSINITFYKDEYAIIHEHYNPSDNLTFARFFGYVVIASRNIASKPYLHHSSPHFESDGNVCNESAAIFERTYSRSLVIAGASRYAVRDRVPNPCQSNYAIADAAHNNLTMFHIFNSAILAATKRWDLKVPNYFLQWHGMSENSCPLSPALISVGTSGNNSIYLNASLAANKLRDAYGNCVNTPYQDPGCNLAATTNIFGRFIDGIARDEVCEKSVPPEDISGHFIHIEQKEKEREDWSGWSKAVKKAFNLKRHCGKKLDNKTKC